MAGNFLLNYIASSNLTVTNLHSLASSQSWIAGWTSGTIDNTSNNYEDYHISAKFTLAAANNQAGEVRVYVYAMLDDSNWNTGVFASGTAGTEGAIALNDTEELDSSMILMWSTVVDTTASAVHAMPKTGVAQFFGGMCPPKFAIYVTGNATTTTTAQFAASGNQVTQAAGHRRYT